MVNTNLFNTQPKAAKANTQNKAVGKAYKTSAEHALAQYACTGCFNGTFYASAKTQLDEVLELARAVDPAFLAKVAVFSRQKGFMKDMPAFLLAVLSTRDTALFKAAFPLVINNGKMVRNFVQVMRSGAVGRKSLGSAPKKMIKKWFERSTSDYIFKASVGKNPAMSDIIKMVHPRPETPERDALYSYLLDGKYDEDALPQLVKDFEAFKKGHYTTRTVPDVPFQMLTSGDLSKDEWKEIAKNGAWHFTRMNLNTFSRHEVYNSKALVNLIADRLKDESLIKKSMVFPYQLLQAYHNTDANVPVKVKNALQDAMEVAVSNVPEFDGKVYVCIDSSGSMGCSATGGYNASLSCRDLSALIASAILRKNEETDVIRFDTTASFVSGINPRDSVMTNAAKLSLQGGGTDCSAPLRLLNAQKAKGDLVVLISDMESWADPYSFYYGGTGTSGEWKKFKSRNKDASLVCINLVAGSTVQAPDDPDVLNVGGFSDQVFTVISSFLEARGKKDFWANKIASEVELG